jgi:hypothetical protein
MSEIEKLMKYAEDKSVATQKSYNQLYRRLRALLGNRDIVSASEKMVLKVIQSENINSKQGLINIAILLRKLDTQKSYTLTGNTQVSSLIILC